MRLYFPRNQEDETFQGENLPEDTGNEKGEPVRIAAMPGRREREQEQEEEEEEEEEEGPGGVQVRDVFDNEFSARRLSPRRRGQCQFRSALEQGGSNFKGLKDLGGWGDGWNSSGKDEDVTYGNHLRKALSTDLSSVASHNFIYQSGEDKQGRVVFVIVGSRFPARDIDSDKALLHIIKVMDASVHKPYAVVYVNANFSVSANQPMPSWMSQVYTVLDRRYKKNIKQFYH
ncbi:hypothetical protein T484DRAFT_1849465, partial [Baffinella frigidus]